MAEECQYYYNDSGWWGSGYTCLLKKSKGKECTISSEWVHKYCWNYNYGDCPFYQAEHGSSSGCYLTSACTEARGLPDDCDELKTLRAFRDGYVRSQPEGEADIRHYYAAAPRIVRAIHALDDKAQPVLDGIYCELVQPCVCLISQQRLNEAYLLYKRYAMQLEEQYIGKQEE